MTTDAMQALNDLSQQMGEEQATTSAPKPDLSNKIFTGRRKSSVARVRIMRGTGVWTINGRTLDDYFPTEVLQMVVNEPFVTLGLKGEYDVKIRVHGGGTSGQAGAVRHAIARALEALDPEEWRKPLKKAGLLTRDDRQVERKKYGLKKARKAPQYSKR